MSAISEALEREVASLRGLGKGDARAGNRHFARLMRLLAPRLRYFIRAYGLGDVAEDAHQVCAIAVLRAIEIYDPARARFTTLVNWQIRGELQALRARQNIEQGGAVRRVLARMVSLDALLEAGDGALERLIDQEATGKVEAGAAAMLAVRACGRLIDEYHQQRRQRPGGAVKPGTLAPEAAAAMEARLELERQLVAHALVGEEDGEPAVTGGLNGEQRRQIARRTIRALAQSARGNPRYDPDAPTWH